jgi:iron complex outermembrane receptor protein
MNLPKATLLKSLKATFFLSVMAILSFASHAFAQNAPGILRGFVTDENKAVISEAKLVLRDENGAERETVSGIDGEFSFGELAFGKYRLTVEKKGFAPFVENVGIASSRELAVRLAPSGFDEFVTVVGGDETYRASTATTAMRADIALRDTPQSIQVVTQQTIQDQNAITAETAVRNVSGVTVPNTSGGRAEDFTIRGFTSSGNTYRDGIRNDFNSNRAHAELSNVERIEVLKGPASILYGRLDPSGVVNYVTKKPRTDRYFSIQTTVGSFGLVRPQIDLGGAFNESKTLLYRFNGAYEKNDTFRDFNRRERFFAAPALTWVIGDKTSLNFEAEALKGTGLIDRGVIAVGTGIAPISIRTFLGDPAIPYKYQQTRASLALSHFFTPDINLRSAFRVNLNKANYDSRQPRSLAANNRTLSLSNNDADQSLQTFYWQTDVSFKFDTAGIKHNVVAGSDLSYESFASQTLTSANRNIDIYNPVYEFAPAPFTLAGLFKNVGRSAGVYAQDLISLRDNLKLLVGGRYDYYYQNNDNRFTRRTLQSYNRKFTPRVGLVYQPIEPVSLYASYSRSFQPINSTDFFGNPFVPETGEQFETGVKFDFLQRRLSATAAVFQITKANVLATDPNDPRNTVQIGKQRSRGFEFDVNVQPVSGWNTILTYAFTDAVITEDTTRNAVGEFFLVGNQLQGTPRRTASLWTSYEFGKGVLRGFGGGAGVFAVGRRFGDNAHTFTVPGYGRVDAAFFYKIYSKEKLRYRVAFNLNNVFDKFYYSGVRGRYSIEPGTPRNGQFTFQAIF